MLARGFRVTGIPLRHIPTRGRSTKTSQFPFIAHLRTIRQSSQIRTYSAPNIRRPTRPLLDPASLLQASYWSLFAVVGATLTAAILTEPYLRNRNQSQIFSPTAPELPEVEKPPSTRALPRTPSYSEMPIPPGHLGNLTSEQELKLRDFWSLTLKTFGVKDPSLTPAAPGISATTPTVGEQNTDSESPSKSKKTSSKKRHSLFSSKKHQNDEESDANSTHSGPGTGGTAAEDDKYGQTKEFQQTLKELSPEELGSAFWAMVKADQPDALLLRFLRARKWDINRALVMLISTMRWRCKEIHVDDDIMRHGEGGALADSKSGDAFAKKEGEDFLAQMRKGKSFLHGVDKEGRPLCFVRVRLHRQGDQSERALERYTVFVIETARLVLRPPVETAVCIDFYAHTYPKTTWLTSEPYVRQYYSTCPPSPSPTWTTPPSNS
jgi:CRAL/TRIO, N-terminal domain/CRAL/TRIO domain